jgi:hypothetical protein
MGCRILISLPVVTSADIRRRSDKNRQLTV